MISFCKKEEWKHVLIGETQLKNFIGSKSGNEVKEQLANANC
ncbi:hypothetical protein [Bacillus cereus]|nr:hypothetical protein [Bacillus cereus]